MDSVVFDVAARPYLIFVMNAVNAVRVKFLAECKKNSRRTRKVLFCGTGGCIGPGGSGSHP